jgi:hypothetical protein
MGRVDQVLHYLRTVRADRGPDGAFLLVGPDGKGPTTFMGDRSETADIVIPAEVNYLVGGRPANLAAGLASTSYGFSVVVF